VTTPCGAGIGSACLSSNAESIRDCEDRAFRAWPGEGTKELSGWVLRHSAVAGTRRTNSAYPVRHTEEADLDGLVRSVETFYAEHDLPARFQLSPASVPAELDGFLDVRGYRKDAPTVVQWANTNDVSEKTPPQPNDHVVICDEMPDDWAHTYRQGLVSDEDLDARLSVIARIRQPKAFARVISEDQTISIGLGVYDSGWAGVFCMFTRLAARRRGAAHQVLGALAHWTLAQGGPYMYLQVEEENSVARTFYDGRGFYHAYGYHYRTQQQ